MAIVTFATFAPSVIKVRDQISAISVVSVATPPFTTTPLGVSPGLQPGPLQGPTFQGPPNQGPVRNIIVEGPTQRGENNFPSNGISLTRQMPPESNPYRLLPENYIMEQWGPNVPSQLQKGFYNLERPLDLLRYKSDRYWNVLSYAGGYSLPQNEINIIPFASINYMSINNQGSVFWQFRPGSIADPLTGRMRSPKTNFLGVFIKEIIRLEANYNVFSASAPTAQTLGGAAAPTTATNFGERLGTELGGGGGPGVGGFGGGGYP